jgi:hypothetical protein
VSEEKSVFGHITDWFRELKFFGLAGLLIGLGFILVFIEGLLYSNNPSLLVYLLVLIGSLMILAGVYIKILEVKERKT